MNPRDQYERTVCGCSKCRRPCRTCPGMLIPGDIERIAEHLSWPVDTVLGNLLASPGALVGVNTPTGVKFGRVPTIVPAAHSGACVFLGEGGRCDIHAVAPYGCSHFDQHMGRAEGDTRSKAALRAIFGSQDYHNTWKELWLAGRQSEPPEVKHALLRNP